MADKVKVSGTLIEQQAEQLRRLSHTPERAAQLAEEVGRLNDAVLDAAEAIDLNDEPARFLATLAELKQPRRGRK